MTQSKDMQEGVGRPGGLSSDDGAASVSTLRASIPDAELLPISEAPRDGTRIILAKYGWTKDMSDLEQGSLSWKSALFDPAAPQKYECWWVVRGYWGANRRGWVDGVDGLDDPTHWMPDFAPPPVCEVPPEGWACTRKPGHDGPCAAVPTTTLTKDQSHDG